MIAPGAGGSGSAGRSGAAALEAAGARVLTDTCAMTTRIDGWGFTHMLTNSAKQAHCAAATGLEVTVAALEACVDYALGETTLEEEDAAWTA